MKFSDYLWALLNRPLKKGAENKKWFTVLGGQFDELKQVIFQLRRVWLIKTAPGKSLDLLGESRGLLRYKNESDELYRERLLAAFDTYVFGGTYPAMQKTLSSLGYSNSDIQLLYKTNPERWAEFNIFLDQKKLSELNNLDIVKKEVRRIKQASALPNYIFTYFENLRIRRIVIIGKSTRRRACGTFKGKEKEFYKVPGYIKKSGLTLRSSVMNWQSNLRTCKSQLKTLRKGFKVSSNLSLQTGFEYKLNSLRVCSKNTKTRRAV